MLATQTDAEVLKRLQAKGLLIKGHNAKKINSFVKEYYSTLILNSFVIGADIRLGRMGRLKFYMSDKNAFVKDNGAVCYNAKLDRKSTNELWAIDPKAKEEKTLVFFGHGDGGNYLYWYKYKPGFKFRQCLFYRSKDFTSNCYTSLETNNFQIKRNYGRNGAR